MSRLAGKVAIVTAADRLPGHEIALGLAAEGAIVVAIGERPDSAGLGSGLADIGGGYQMHVPTSETAWVELMEQVLAEHGGLDILVNTAASEFRAISLEETTVEDFDELFERNVEAVFLGLRSAMNAMTATSEGGGSIINLCSRLGMRGQAGATAFCATQGAVTQLTLAAAVDGAKEKVRVNVIHAGSLDGSPPAGSAVAEAPLGRTGQSADLVGAVVYLASDEARIVTGSELTIDGGVNAS
jgi:3alpha(or 20beta)-hydroxysteroid dehydrogenase